MRLNGLGSPSLYSSNAASVVVIDLLVVSCLLVVLVLVSVRRSALDFPPSNGEQWLRSAAAARALGVRRAVQSYVG